MKRVKKGIRLIDYWTRHFELSDETNMRHRIREVQVTVVKAMKAGQTSCTVARIYQWKHYIQTNRQATNASPMTSPRAHNLLTHKVVPESNALFHCVGGAYQLKDWFRPLLEFLQEEGLQWTIGIEEPTAGQMPHRWADLIVYWTPTLDGHDSLASHWMTQLAVKTLDDSRVVEWRKICLRAMQAGQHTALLMVLFASDYCDKGGQLQLHNRWDHSVVYSCSCQLESRFSVVEAWTASEGVHLLLATESAESDWVFLMAHWSTPASQPTLFKDLFEDQDLEREDL